MLKCVITFSLLSSPPLMFQHYPQWQIKKWGHTGIGLLGPGPTACMVAPSPCMVAGPVPLRNCPGLPFGATCCVECWGFRGGLVWSNLEVHARFASALQQAALPVIQHWGCEGREVCVWQLVQVSRLWDPQGAK